MQQVFFTVSYVYIDELMIDEKDKSVRQPSSKGQPIAPLSGEELPEFVITEHSSTPKPRATKSSNPLSFSKYQCCCQPYQSRFFRDHTKFVSHTSGNSLQLARWVDFVHGFRENPCTILGQEMGLPGRDI